jgi:hypothetical protein
MPDPRRRTGFTKAVLLCPIFGYSLAWVFRSIEQLIRGQGFHPFRPFFGIGSHSMLNLGHHQWSPRTILVYYGVCLAVALPLLAVARSRRFDGCATLCMVWAVACGTYFVLLGFPYGVAWRMGLCGAVAGSAAGLLT